MIDYDSHNQLTMLRIQGSLMPAALKMGVVVAFAAFILKWAEIEGHITFPSQMVKSSSLYSGFSFTLSFMLVFRTSQSYNRFWHAATSMNSMRSQWYEAASSICKFLEMSDHPAEEVLIF